MCRASSLIGALKNNCIATYGTEINPAYVKIGSERLDKLAKGSLVTCPIYQKKNLHTKVNRQSCHASTKMGNTITVKFSNTNTYCSLLNYLNSLTVNCHSFKT